jgi:HEAT repeat protein
MRVRSGVFSALVVAIGLATAGCERARKRNVPEGEERVVKAAEARPWGDGTGAGSGAGAANAAEGPSAPVSAEEARRRATVRRLGERYDAAKTPEDRADAVEKIGQMGPAAADLVPKLADAAADTDPLVRAFAARARAAVGDSTAEAAILKALADADPTVRLAAAESLGLLPEASRLTALALIGRRESDSRVQEAFLDALRNDPTPAVASAVAALLRDQSNPGVELLSLSAARRAIPILLARPAEGAAAADALSVYLGRHDPVLRADVASALGKLDVRTKTVRAALIDALTDPEIDVRTKAFETLKAWSGQGFGYDPASDGATRGDAIRAFSEWSNAKN